MSPWPARSPDPRGICRTERPEAETGACRHRTKSFARLFRFSLTTQSGRPREGGTARRNLLGSAPRAALQARLLGPGAAWFPTQAARPASHVNVGASGSGRAA